jgi:hypothetical protein
MWSPEYARCKRDGSEGLTLIRMLLNAEPTTAAFGGRM